MLPIAETRHHIPGRIRLRLDAGRRDPGLLERVARAVSTVSGVRRTEVNPSAAVVVIEYDPAAHDDFSRTLAEYAEREQLFAMQPTRAVAPAVNRSLTDQALDTVFGRVNRGVQDVTAGVVNLKELLPLGIAASAMLFVDRAAVAAQWLSWIQFAWSSYWDLHQDEPVEEVGQQVQALKEEVAAVRQLLEERLNPQH